MADWLFKPIPVLTEAQFARFWSKVDAQGDCWEWTAYRDECGYGRLGLWGSIYTAHRVAYATMVGPISDGLEVDHLCFNRGCVNPDHLDVVTPEVNKSRTRHGLRLGQTQMGGNSLKTHCPQGHEYTPDNIYWGRGGRTHRMCKECTRLRNRERVRRRTEARRLARLTRTVT